MPQGRGADGLHSSGYKNGRTMYVCKNKRTGEDTWPSGAVMRAKRMRRDRVELWRNLRRGIRLAFT